MLSPCRVGACRRYRSRIGDNGRRDARPEPLRLMAVHAHPDDESSKGAATMARYVDEGVEVLVVTCTGGERGSILNPALKDRADIEANIAEIRRAEMARAREILGRAAALARLRRLRAARGRPAAAAARGLLRAGAAGRGASSALVREVRRFRPHVMTTYDENGGYPHPDHIRCHEISVAAFEAAADPDAFPDAGEPWQPLKLYYDVGFTMRADRGAARGDARRRASSRRSRSGASGARSGPSKRRRAEHHHPGARAPTGSSAATPRCSPTPPRSTPNGWFFKVPLDLQREVWPTEDFELARSLVDSTAARGRPVRRASARRVTA